MRGATQRASQEVGKAIAILSEPKKQVIKYAPQRLPPMPSFKDLLSVYRIYSKKHLSQNFLMNPRTIRKLVLYSHLKPEETVVEIGPGPGNITREILRRGPKELFVIEKDRRFLPMLEMLADAAHPGQMKIILGDVLDYTLTGLFDPSLKREWDDKPPPIHIISNVPFNISAALLIKWLRQIHSRSGPFEYGRVPMSLTFQWELALRIGSDCLQYGRSRIAAMTQLWCKVERKMQIPGSHFYPKPQVDAGFIRLIPRREPLVPAEIPFSSVEKFIKNLFHLRRKHIKNALRLLFPPGNMGLIEKICSEAGVSSDDTPVMLSNEELARMLQIYWDIIKDEPELANYDHLTRKREPRILKDMFAEKGYRINKIVKEKPDERNLNE